MPSLHRAFEYLLHNRKQFLDSTVKNLGFLLPDKLYLSIRYRLLIGHKLNWSNPQSFTEKIQWLKIYDYRKEYSYIVDKRLVKQMIADKIGQQYVIPTLAVYDTVDDIEWESLPQQFVLKTTHGGGSCGVVVCKDKEKFDISKARTKLSESMSGVAGKEFREKPYYNVERKIIVEKYIEPSDGELKDYKFFCSKGKVICFKVDFGRFVEHHANYYDIEGNLLPFGEIGLEPDYSHIEKFPSNLDKMLDVASILSREYKFNRVDLYNVDGQIYFGELTFYPGGGLVPLTSNDWDIKIGNQIDLSNENTTIY